MQFAKKNLKILGKISATELQSFSYCLRQDAQGKMGQNRQHFLKNPLPILQLISIYHIFDGHKICTFREGKGVRGSFRGFRAEPQKWPIWVKTQHYEQ